MNIYDSDTQKTDSSQGPDLNACEPRSVFLLFQWHTSIIETCFYFKSLKKTFNQSAIVGQYHVQKSRMVCLKLLSTKKGKIDRKPHILRRVE